MSVFPGESGEPPETRLVCPECNWRGTNVTAAATALGFLCPNCDEPVNDDDDATPLYERPEPGKEPPP